MFVKNSEKKKVSIDFDLNNYDLLVQFGKKYKKSNSQIINFLIEHLLNLSQDAKKRYAKCTFEQLELQKKLYSNCDVVEAREVEQQIAILHNLLLFFTDQKGFHDEEVNIMKRIDMPNSYALIPENWIIVNSKMAKDCNYAGVVECRNGKRYNVPHFLFFSEVPIIQLTDAEEERILSDCEAHYPNFKYIRSMQVVPVYDENHNLLNAEIFEKSPTIGIFALPEYGKDASFPAGAMLVRHTSI